MPTESTVESHRHIQCGISHDINVNIYVCNRIFFFAVSSCSFERLKCKIDGDDHFLSIYAVCMSDYYSYMYQRNHIHCVRACIRTRVQIFCFILDRSNVCINLNDLAKLKCIDIKEHMNAHTRTQQQNVRCKAICMWFVWRIQKHSFSSWIRIFSKKLISIGNADSYAWGGTQCPCGSEQTINTNDVDKWYSCTQLHTQTQRFRERDTRAWGRDWM